MLNMITEGGEDRKRNLETAVSFVWPALDLSQKRIAYVNRLLEGLAAVGITVNLGVLAYSGNRDRMEPSCDLLLYLALGCGLLAIGIALATRTIPKLTGSAKFIYLKETIETGHISASVDSYNYSMVNHANDLVENNDDVSGKRLRVSFAVTLLYLVESALLVLWLVL